MEPSPRVVVVTVSDTRTDKTDASGPTIVAALQADGIKIVRHAIVADDVEAIRALVQTIDADALVLTGGTGIGPRDRTFEALAPLYTMTLDGFGETFRRLSFDQIGARAILSRASAGVVGDVLVFSLPGSVNAAKLGVELILPMLRHAVAQRAGPGAH